MSKTISFRVDQKAYETFGSICDSEKMSPSEALKSFVEHVNKNPSAVSDFQPLGVADATKNIDVFLTRILQGSIVAAVASTEILRNGGGREMEVSALRSANELLNKTLAEIDEERHRRSGGATP